MGGYQGLRLIYALDEKRKVGSTILWHDNTGKARAEDWSPWAQHDTFLKDYLKPEIRKVIVDAAE
jgi:hypothetical protein